MKEFLVWWIGIEAVGLAAFPLTYAFLRCLPDRGFAFSKMIGLLLLAYGVWAGAVVGVISNSRGSIILVLLLIAGLSALVAVRHRGELVGVLRSGWRYMAFVEGLFFVVLAMAVFLRSFAPEIMWGEKPFELAFLNSVTRSESFPPNDPWLSGQPISYYYFGYLMIGVLTKLVALSTATTFYLGLSLIAALASVAVFGLVYNMIAVSRRRQPALAEGSQPGERSAPTEGPSLIPRAVVFGLAGAALMAIVSNLAGVFELLARHGIGSRGFYSFVGIFDLNESYNCGVAPGDCTDWYPTRFWWWWKATRMGSPFDIQEFPFFSFQFGDLHPHVLVMPFLITLLAVAFAIVLRARRDGDAERGRGLSGALSSAAYPWRSLLLALLAGAMVLASALALDVKLAQALALAAAMGGVQFVLGALSEDRATEGGPERLDALWWLRSPGQYLLLSLLLGGVVFIDAWAMPLALMITLAAAAVANWIRTGGRPLEVIGDSVGFALPIAAAMFFFYLPFHINLDLEADGLNITQAAVTDSPPPDSEATRPLHFLLFWGPLLWVGLSFVAVHVYRRWREMAKPPLLALAALLWALPAAVWLAWILGRDGFSGVADEISERGGNLVTILGLAVAVTLVGLAFLHQLRKPAAEQDRGQLFTFQLAGFAFLMLLGAELFFVKDLLGWRANTVFRFWHESWIILSVVGGFGLYRLTLNWRMPEVNIGSAWPLLPVFGVLLGGMYTILVAVEPWDVLYAKWWTATLGIFVAGASVVGYLVAGAVRGAPRSLAWQRLSWLGVTAVVLAAALVYPVTVTLERTDGFRHEQSLNGLVHVQRGRPAEFEAIEYLTESVSGAPVIVEAVGRSFSDGARVSSRTGLPTVLGWPSHERTWRGSSEPFAGREDDVRSIYETTDVSEARRLLDKYDVEYVYVGYLERNTYGEAGLAKFREFMTPVFENDSVIIYRLLEQAAVARPN